MEPYDPTDVIDAIACHKAACAARLDALDRGDDARLAAIDRADGDALKALVETPCADDAQFIIKLRYLIENFMAHNIDGERLFDDGLIHEEAWEIEVALALHFGD